MTREISTTTNSILPTLFRVGGEAHGNASVSRILLGVGFVAGSIFVLVKWFTPKPPPSSSPKVKKIDIEEGDSDEKVRKLAQTQVDKEQKRSPSPRLQRHVVDLRVHIKDSSDEDEREGGPSTTPFSSPTSDGETTFAGNWQDSLQVHNSPKSRAKK